MLLRFCKSAFWGVSSATGDLVDNHDIVQFVVRPLDGTADPDADHDAWVKQQEAQRMHQLEEFDLRPPEALQRDYQRVLRAQAGAIKSLTADVEVLKQQLEFQCAPASLEESSFSPDGGLRSHIGSPSHRRGRPDTRPRPLS